MIGLNLLPDVKKEFLKAQRTRNMVIGFSILAMFVAGGVTVFLALFVYVGQNTAISAVRNDIKKKQITLEGKSEITKYLTIQNQLSTLKVLHGKDHKVLASRLFDYLPQLNPAVPNNVQLNMVKASSKDKTISIQGTTSNFQSLDTFKNTLENAKLTYKSGSETSETELFSEVSLKSAALTQANAKQTVSFEFSLSYDADIFSPDIGEYQLIVPKLTISDAKNNAPSELFSSGESE